MKRPAGEDVLRVFWTICAVTVLESSALVIARVERMLSCSQCPATSKGDRLPPGVRKTGVSSAPGERG